MIGNSYHTPFPRIMENPQLKTNKDATKYLDSLSNNETIVCFYSYDFIELPDLSRFKNLDYIECVDNPNLMFIGENLPDTVTYIKFSGSRKLKVLPNKLPSNLITLDCDHNALIKLPKTLPNKLKYLFCFDNLLTCLPDKLPDSLKQIDVNENNINILPDKLPHCINYIKFNNIMYPELIGHRYRFCDKPNDDNYKSYTIYERHFDYIYRTNIQIKAIDRMALLNRNGVLLEHAARITGNPSLISSEFIS